MSSINSPAAVASNDELAAALDALYKQGDFVFDARIPPVGRKFETGNKVRRRFGTETVAQVCALRQLGCTVSGIQKILGQMYTPKPAYQTVKELLEGEVYKELRTGPGFAARHEHYLHFFEGTFKALPNWRPSVAAVQQAQSASAGSRYKGSAGNAWQAAVVAPAVDTPDYNSQRMADAAAARAKARTARQYPA